VTATGLAELFAALRGELVLDSGLTYDGLAPVLVHAGKREGRYSFSDGGSAVALAGRPAGWRERGAELVEREHGLNLGRQGVVSVPATARQRPDWIATLPDRVANASAALYSALLELEA
jgi:hypothetical protein